MKFRFCTVTGTAACPRLTTWISAVRAMSSGPTMIRVGLMVSENWSGYRS